MSSSITLNMVTWFIWTSTEIEGNYWLLPPVHPVGINVFFFLLNLNNLTEMLRKLHFDMGSTLDLMSDVGTQMNKYVKLPSDAADEAVMWCYTRRTVPPVRRCVVSWWWRLWAELSFDWMLLTMHHCSLGRLVGSRWRLVLSVSSLPVSVSMCFHVVLIS